MLHVLESMVALYSNTVRMQIENLNILLSLRSLVGMYMIIIIITWSESFLLSFSFS